MLTVHQALQRILSSVRTLSARRLKVSDCSGLVLAEPVRARVDLPSFDNSSVDGFAVRARDVRGATRGRFARLKRVEEIWAGHWPRRRLGKRTCSRVATGSPIPKGADAVVMKEDALLSFDGKAVSVRHAVSRDENVRRRGEDVKKGEGLLPAGRPLKSMDLMLAAQTGNFQLTVVPRPRVAVVSTGDELQGPSHRLKRGKIFDGNGEGLASLVTWAGGGLVQKTRVRDNPRDLRRVLSSVLRSADIVLTCGGISVGERDYVRFVLRSLGARERFWKIAMKPGRPMAFFQKGKKTIFGLPGNPVSAFVTFLLFVKPVIEKLSGRGTSPLFTVKAQGERRGMPFFQRQAVLTKPAARAARRQFLRGILEQTSRRWVVRSAGGQESHRLRSLVNANCLYEIPEGRGTLPRGAHVRVYPFAF